MKKGLLNLHKKRAYAKLYKNGGFLVPKKGLKVAIEYGEKLREFESILEADKFFLKYKAELLIQLELVSQESHIFIAIK